MKFKKTNKKSGKTAFTKKLMRISLIYIFKTCSLKKTKPEILITDR